LSGIRRPVRQVIDPAVEIDVETAFQGELRPNNVASALVVVAELQRR